MDDRSEFLIKRLTELSERAYHSNTFFFSDFLDEAEQAVYYSLKPKVLPSGSTAFGGYEEAGRRMIRFGSPELFGYEEAFPISCIHVFPVIEKFADEMTHRDFLGSIMALGLERDVIGDLLPSGRDCWVFCESGIAGFICDNLISVRHTHVRCEPVDTIPEDVRPRRLRLTAQAASSRADAVVAAVCGVSRGKADELFHSRKIFVNERCCENRSYILKDGELLSIRGFGKLRYLGTDGSTRKGRSIISYEKFV